MTFYPLEQTQTEGQTCGICCESEVGVPHNSGFPSLRAQKLGVSDLNFPVTEVGAGISDHV